LKTEAYKEIILSVLYGCETWYLTQREEQILRVFVNREHLGVRKCGLDASGLGEGTVAVSCENGDGSLGNFLLTD
jgi:hypothetical protein